jgi:hypothetical protein
MINHTIQRENVKRFVNLNHPDGVKEVFSILLRDTAYSRSSLWRHVAYHWLFGIKVHCGYQ